MSDEKNPLVKLFDFSESNPIPDASVSLLAFLKVIVWRIDEQQKEIESLKRRLSES